MRTSALALAEVANDEGQSVERSLPEIEGEIVELAAHIDAATFQLLEDISEFDRRKGWEEGFLSCAHWLSWRTGMDLVTARERVRVAQALGRLPRVGTAFREGRLSYSKVRAIIRVATPENEEDLVRLALDATASQIEKLARRYRDACRAQDCEHAKGQHRERYLNVFTDDDGMVVIHGRLPPELGALVQKALDAAVQALNQQRKETSDDSAESSQTEESTEEIAEQSEWTPGGEAIQEPGIAFSYQESEQGKTHDTAESSEEEDEFQQLQADALGLLAEAALGRGLEATERSEAYQVVVHVDAQTLAGLAGNAAGEIEGDHLVPVETCRRLACDVSHLIMLHGAHGEVLHAGRKTRRISLPLWRALRNRDRTCRFPGCNRVGRLAAHHIHHWAHGGETGPENLILLCSAHHWAVHEGGFRVAGRTSDELIFTCPDGSVLYATPALPRVRGVPLRSLADLLAKRGLSRVQDEEPGEQQYHHWHYERLDYDLALAGLMSC